MKTTLLVGTLLAAMVGYAHAGQTQSGQTQSVPATQTASQQTASSAQPVPQAAGTPAATQEPSDSLPVSLDRIRKALTTEAPPNPVAKQLDTQDGLPRFAIATESPRTIKFSDILANNKTAVSAYVRPPFDMYHYEFLEMVTPDEVKGCMQLDTQTCTQAYFSRLASGLAWQGLFKGLTARPTTGR